MSKRDGTTEKIDVFEPYEVRRERNRATREASLAAARKALDTTLKAHGLPAGHGVVNSPPLNPSWLVPRRVSARPSRASQGYVSQVHPKTSRDAGGNTYFGGPCKRHPGHNERYSSNGDCVLCARARSRGLIMTPGQARAAGVKVTGIWAAVESGDAAMVIIECVICGEPFAPKGHGRRAPLYCSKVCAGRAARRQERERKRNGGAPPPPGLDHERNC